MWRLGRSFNAPDSAFRLRFHRIVPTQLRQTVGRENVALMARGDAGSCMLKIEILCRAKVITRRSSLIQPASRFGSAFSLQSLAIREKATCSECV
ncbi:Hypothetical protein NTJ_02180 [Nesidiocoris tenuis]|uniref:Uncharacterized protein n=1 Tax=Nesidiocoris tenuis TaxID=355587 RepID=A0ABN7ABH4_9HEMI|nr:Hypothetical protein NTJ_02180 [Nesidiocoris tenuis]